VRGLKLPQRLFLIPDAIGLALFAITGIQVALNLLAPWLVAGLLGVTTGVVGGVLQRMSRRARQPNPLAGGEVEFVADAAGFAEDFRIWYVDARVFAEDWRQRHI
jgi:hypothetical protein